VLASCFMDTSPGETLLPDVVVGRGGWHPAYARVVLIEQNAHLAVVLVDGNGDGAELEVEYWSRDNEWQPGPTSGYGPLDGLTPFASWQPNDDFVCALGRARPGDLVLIDYAGTTHQRLANEFGLWGFIADARPDGDAELPKLAD
jgi:hypothetical protein